MSNLASQPAGKERRQPDGHDNDAHHDQPVETEQGQKGPLVVQPQVKCARLVHPTFDRLGDQQVSTTATVSFRGRKLRQRIGIVRVSAVNERSAVLHQAGRHHGGFVREGVHHLFRGFRIIEGQRG